MQQPKGLQSEEIPVLSSRDSLGDSGVINPQQRQIIATSTRNIAALALQRRSKASLNELNVQQRERLHQSMGLGSNKRFAGNNLEYLAGGPVGAGKANSDNKLTESRLAMHNKRYPAQRRQAFEDVVASSDHYVEQRSRHSRSKPKGVVLASKGQGRYRATRQGGHPTRQSEGANNTATTKAPQSLVQAGSYRQSQGTASYQQVSWVDY